MSSDNSSTEEELLKIIYENIDKYYQGLKRKCESINKVSISILNLVDFLIPDENSETEKIVDIYDDTSDREISFSKSVQRLSEDIRDIFERKKVIDKLTKEQEEHLETHNKMKQFYEANKDSPKYANKKSELKETLIQSRDSLKRETEYLISQREKYSRFVVNRLTHGFETYSNALEELGINNQIAYRQLYEKLTDYPQERFMRIKPEEEDK